MNSEKKKPLPQNRPKKSQLNVMALGGLGEVGKNCYVVEYKNDLFVIDYGVLFPSKEQLGIDYIIPNYNYLIKNKNRIKALFITHGHEDHIGGVPFLLKKLKIPKIYAPITAKLMIEKKFKEHKLETTITEINDSTELSFGNVTVYMYRQTHSIPDSLGIFFETPLGNVVTTGDFKVDFSPPGQNAPDFHKMAELSKKGVLCLLSDSTNALTPGFSLSESTVGRNLKTLINEAQGRILFTTFASNIYRVQQMIEGSLEAGRKVCIMGRSLTNGLAIGQKTGYMKITSKDLIDPKQIKNYEDDKVTIICTGSQGEELAALSRIATGQNTHIELSDSDTVVFASNPIPGNNYQIGRVIDALHKTKCRIIKNTDFFKTHASGHASQEEQKLLITMWKPKYFMPVHGTYTMLKAHQKTAQLLGIEEKNTYIADNGDVLCLDAYKPYFKRKAVAGQSIYVSGKNVDVSLTDGTMDKLASDGIMLFTAIYDINKNLISYPQTITRGFIVINKSLDFLRKVQKAFLESYHAHKNLPLDKQKYSISKDMSSFIYKITKKKPYISTELVEYKPEEVKFPS